MKLSIEELKQAIQTKSGPELIDFIQEDIGQLKKILFDPQSLSCDYGGTGCVNMGQ